MGTKFLVLGMYSFGVALALLVIHWLVSPENPVLPPFYVVTGAYWLYSAWKILSGRDAGARKVEAYLNRGRS